MDNTKILKVVCEGQIFVLRPDTNIIVATIIMVIITHKVSKLPRSFPARCPGATFEILWGDGKDARYGGEKFPEPELKALPKWVSTSPEPLKPHHLAMA